MNTRMIAAAVALAHTLTEENEALRALDVTRAVGLLARKRADTEAFASAQAEMRAMTGEHRALAMQVAARLSDAAAENKRLLERAIAVQGQVIATLLRAIPAALPTARYGARGARIDRAAPISLSSRI